MIIKDLFSHKIHSSKDSWANKLVDLAFVFNEFDRKPYNRKELEKRLSKMSPRASSVARDPSKFRDEISAYPAYLGLYRVELIENEWHFILSDTAKTFLIKDEPNVPAFMLLQLLLFQYPNGMGVAYYSNSNKVRIQANSRDRTLEFIKHRIHLSPLRLICKAIQAETILSSKTIFESSITYDEILALANDQRVNKYTSPPIESVLEVLTEIKKGNILPPKPYESRFHILKHTDFIVPTRSTLHLRNPINEKDRKELELKFNTINELNISFEKFDKALSSNQILESIVDGTWGKFFDGVRTFNADIVEILTAEEGLFQDEQLIDTKISKPELDKIISPRTYKFRKRNNDENLYTTYSYPKIKVDPEITRIKRQKSNLNHKLILQNLEDYLESIGCSPLENDHIDLYAEIPDDGKYLFEVKSTTKYNLLSQTRKGVSQLYEYRFRYQDIIGYDVNLCLVFPKRPEEIKWLEEYLCEDRKIGIIWFNEQGNLEYSQQGRALISPLLK